jgi:hypothetical protein
MPGTVIPPPPFTDVAPPAGPPPALAPPVHVRAGAVLGLAGCLGGAGAATWGAAELAVRGLPWGACVVGAVDLALVAGALAFAVPVAHEVGGLVYDWLERGARLMWHERHLRTAARLGAGYADKWYGAEAPPPEIPVNNWTRPAGRDTTRVTNVDEAPPAPAPPGHSSYNEEDVTDEERINFWEALEDRLVGWLRPTPTTQRLSAPTGALPDRYDAACRYVVEAMWTDPRRASLSQCERYMSRQSWQRACTVLCDRGVFEYVDPRNPRRGFQFSAGWRAVRVEYADATALHRAVGAAVRGYVNE